jgi:hypothetical protein
MTPARLAEVIRRLDALAGRIHALEDRHDALAAIAANKPGVPVDADLYEALGGLDLAEFRGRTNGSPEGSPGGSSGARSGAAPGACPGHASGQVRGELQVMSRDRFRDMSGHASGQVQVSPQFSPQDMSGARQRTGSGCARDALLGALVTHFRAVLPGGSRDALPGATVPYDRAVITAGQRPRTGGTTGRQFRRQVRPELPAGSTP